ncbi:MAG: hypothetical protein ACK8QZ_03375 [Anaerolineales bacterium]
MIHALAERGFESRQVHWNSGEPPNDFDDGHICFEAKIDGQWRLFDSVGHYYTDANGKHLSLSEVADADLDDLTMQRIASMGPPSTDALALTGPKAFPYRAAYETYYSSEARFRAWAGRLFRVPAILHSDGYVYCYLPQDVPADHISRDWRITSKTQWLNKLYGHA